MRLVPLAIAASVALAGCGKEQATGNTSALDQAVTAEDFETNDVTAIDAATGAAANMAADVDFNVIGTEDANDSAATARPAPVADDPATEAAANNTDD